MKHSVGAMDGAKANACNSITRQFATQIGEKCGLAMKKLVERGEETVHEEPPFPDKGGEKAAAVWKFKTKIDQDKMLAHSDKKEKVFSCILGKCDDTVITRLESVKEHEAAESDGDVAALMGLIKKLVVGASDRAHPGLQAANAWKTLGRMQQHDDESLLKCHRRFMAAVEHVEDTCGKIEPKALTKKKAVGGDAEQARNKFLVCIFIAGSNESKFEGYRKKLADDCASDQVSRHPETVQDAVSVMQTYLDNHDGGGCKGVNFNQGGASKIKCFYCKELGRIVRDCPKKKEDDNHEEGGLKMPKSSHVTVWGERIDD